MDVCTAHNPEHARQNLLHPKPEVVEVIRCRTAIVKAHAAIQSDHYISTVAGNYSRCLTSKIAENNVQPYPEDLLFVFCF